VDQPGVRRAKAARIEVERLQSRVEVHVQPLASGRFRVLRCEVDDPRSYALALVSAVRLRVDDKGMVSTVRYDVDEADETPAGLAGSDPAQTVWTDSIPPADVSVSAMGLDELDHLRVGQRAAPAVRDAVGDELWSNSGRSQNNQIIQLGPAPRATFPHAGTADRLDV
jgi:hypothetical protein